MLSSYGSEFIGSLVIWSLNLEKVAMIKVFRHCLLGKNMCRIKNAINLFPLWVQNETIVVSLGAFKLRVNILEIHSIDLRVLFQHLPLEVVFFLSKAANHTFRPRNAGKTTSCLDGDNATFTWCALIFSNEMTSRCVCHAHDEFRCHIRWPKRSTGHAREISHYRGSCDCFVWPCL